MTRQRHGWYKEKQILENAHDLDAWGHCQSREALIQELSGKFRGIIEIIEWVDLLGDEIMLLSRRLASGMTSTHKRAEFREPTQSGDAVYSVRKMLSLA